MSKMVYLRVCVRVYVFVYWCICYFFYIRISVCVSVYVYECVLGYIYALVYSYVCMGEKEGVKIETDVCKGMVTLQNV